MQLNDIQNVFRGMAAGSDSMALDISPCGVLLGFYACEEQGTSVNRTL
jgi:hypothetical protein